MSNSIFEITRRELYEMVWSIGQTKSASYLGISPNQLKKCLNLYDIPYPNSAYFIRREFGHAVDRESLPDTFPSEEVIKFVNGRERSFWKKQCDLLELQAIKRTEHETVKAEATERRKISNAEILVRNPSKIEIERWSLTQKREKELRTKRLNKEKNIIDALSTGASIAEIANELHCSYATVYQRYRNVVRRVSLSEGKPQVLVEAIVRPRAAGRPPLNGQGPYSGQSVNPHNVEQLYNWEEAARRIMIAQEDHRADDPFYDIRGWLRARTNRDSFECPYTVSFHDLAWRMLANDETVCAGTIRCLASDLGISEKLCKSKNIFTRKILEPVQNDLTLFGDFDMDWVIKLSGGLLMIDLRFCKKRD